MPSLLMASTVPAFIKAFLLPLAEHFRSQGWRVDAMANDITSDGECSSCFDAVWDVKWSRNPLNPSNFRQAPAMVRKAVRQGGYDIVHVHTPVASLVCRYALRRHPDSVKICTAHGFHFHEHGKKIKNSVFLALEKCAGLWTDYLVVMNQFDEAAARKYRLVPPQRLVYMPGIGVDTKGKYNPACVAREEILAFRKSIQAEPHDPVVLVPAEFISRKRHIDALQAWKQLGIENAHLVFAGSGPTQSSMMDVSRQLDLNRRVHFLGLRSDIPVLVRASQAVLLCSDQEGLPRSIMEALSLGTPVIGSNIRGTRELLENGAGYLYPARDVQALTRVLKQVLNDPVEAGLRAKIGQQQIVAYDLQHIIRLHEDLYTAALETKGRFVQTVASALSGKFIA